MKNGMFCINYDVRPSIPLLLPHSYFTWPIGQLNIMKVMHLLSLVCTSVPYMKRFDPQTLRSSLNASHQIEYWLNPHKHTKENEHTKCGLVLRWD